MSSKEIEIINQQDAKLAELKEQFLKLRSQYHQERKEASLRSLTLQKELREEERRCESLLIKLNELKSSTAKADPRSVKIVRDIWYVISASRICK